MLACINAILEKKGQDIVLMTIREICSFADFFLICTGTSVRHTKAIADAIQEAMKKAGSLPRGVEGETAGTWILLDYQWLIVHIFFEDMRHFYDLENLWADAPTIHIDDKLLSLKALPG